MAWVNVTEEEVLLLWRALLRFRSACEPACAPRGGPSGSMCPLFEQCPRWHNQPSGRPDENVDAEQQRAAWPCSRLLTVLAPDQDRRLRVATVLPRCDSPDVTVERTPAPR